MQPPLRLTEWSRVAHDLSTEKCCDIEAVLQEWRRLNELPVCPLSFSGPDGRQLCARQYVGVIEVGDTAIEIYPKLDSALLVTSEIHPIAQSVEVDTVMRNLLWMLEVAEHRTLLEAATAHLEEAPTSFFDLFAYLLGKNLLPELELGPAHAYVTFQDDLKIVRGRIGIVDQVTRNWNRFDRVFCAWDEFTPNTAINRLFKCACRFLSERVGYVEASRILLDCQTLLAEVEDVPPATALHDVLNLHFDRSFDRFRTAFDLSKRLLSGIGHRLGVGATNTFVFLLDMNKLFENYVHAVLEDHFDTHVEEQRRVGQLLCVDRGGMSQIPDYCWEHDHALWIGDAKYKHLAKGHRRALRFTDLTNEQNEFTDSMQLAGQILSPGDVRQLTTYGELLRIREGPEKPVNLMLLYPFVGAMSECVPDCVTAWNGSLFYLMPVQVTAQECVGDAIRDIEVLEPEALYAKDCHRP